MKAMIIAAGLIAVGAMTANAQGSSWSRDRYPYAQRYHAVCQEKAQRLYRFEHRSARDGVLTFEERRTISALQRDLDGTCGRFRWRG
jgi:hypothetical protein